MKTRKQLVPAVHAYACNFDFPIKSLMGDVKDKVLLESLS